MEILLDRLNIQYTSKSYFTINLSHPLDVTGPDRWLKYTEDLAKLNEMYKIGERRFTKNLEETKDLYIGQVIQEVKKQHKGKCQGRNQLIWLGPGASYSFHQDHHAPARYHIPFITHEDCYWNFVYNGEILKLHMPADQQVWFVNTKRLIHTFVNDSPISRCHLMISSVI